MIDDPAPADIVPRAPLSIRDLARLDKQFAADRQVSYTVPGNVIEDPDGIPIGVEAPVTGTGATLCAPTIHAADVRHLGSVAELRSLFAHIHFYNPEEH